MVKTNNKFYSMNKHFVVSVLLGITMLCTSQNVFAQKMTLTITTNYTYVDFTLGGEGEVTINWGDGKSDNDFLGPKSIVSSHRYPHKGTWTITITGANVRYLDCALKGITSLDVSKNIQLEELKCHVNQLTSLNVSNNIKLKKLQCGSNNITSLNVSKNIELTELACGGNQFTSLDVSKNIKLEELYCSYSWKIISLDVSKNIELKNLQCGGNLLTSLDVSKNIKLEKLKCDKNKLTYPALNALFESLPENDVENKEIDIGGNSGVVNCDRSIAEKKGWRVSINY